MDDITILYVTANELPQEWMDFQIGHLLQAAKGAKIISLSRKPMDLGTNVLDGDVKSYWNIYSQMLRGALLATTPYVAMAEDDVLYTVAHFDEYRPQPDAVAYDRSRWSLFTWEKEPMYCVRQRLSNCSLIAPRELLIQKITERQEKWPTGAPHHLVGEVGREKVEKKLGVSVTKCEEWYSYGPIVQLNHEFATEDRQKTKWKRHGQIRAYDIPHWGRASDLVKRFKESR